MADISLQVNNGLFNYKVGAIIIHDEKILMIKNDVFPYYYTVGGRVIFGETSEVALLRETYEETQVNFEIDRLAFIHENFFIADFMENKFCHEIALYYHMKPSPDLDNLICNSTGGNGEKESLHWLLISELQKYPVFPDFYKTELSNLKNEVIHFVTKEEKTYRAL